jgi:hypothetical protein
MVISGGANMNFPMTCETCRLEAGGGCDEPVTGAQGDFPAVGSIAGIRTLLEFRDGVVAFDQTAVAA